MRNRLYHQLTKTRSAVEGELRQLEQHRCSAKPAYQKLLRMSLHLRRAEKAYFDSRRDWPLCPPIIRTHWGPEDGIQVD
jgi:hypothetical protein